MTPTMAITMIQKMLPLPAPLLISSMAMEPPASAVTASHTTSTQAMNTATVASHTFTKSVYTGFQRPCSLPRRARSTSRLL